jgi:hypothetical protein
MFDWELTSVAEKKGIIIEVLDMTRNVITPQCSK